MKSKLGSLAAVSILLSTTGAFADDAKPEPPPPPPAEATKAGAIGDSTNHFGEKGTIALHVTTGPMIGGLSGGGTPTFGLETRKFKPEGGEERSNTFFYVNPRVHYFIVHNISIGGEILVARSSGQGDSSVTGIGLMPKLGFDLLFGEKVSFYPQAGIGYRHLSSTINGATGGSIDTSESWLFADVDLPLLIHPVKNLAVGIGPQFTFTLSQSTKVGDASTGSTTTSFRWLTAHLIGWF